MNFYKLKNGNISFEYDMNVRLERIENLLGNKQDDLLSAVIGAVIADYISTTFLENTWFIPVLLVTFGITKFIIFLFHRIIIVLKSLHSKDFTSDSDQLVVQNVFWNKIVPKIIMGMSLINRNETTNIGINKDYQSDLHEIYVYQARRCFWEAAEDINNYFLSVNDKKLKEYVFVIDREPVLWACDMSIKYLKYIATEINLDEEDQIEKKFYEKARERIEKI